MAFELIDEDNVQWVVNTLGELGVKIGNQFFFLYKGRSLVYDSSETTIRWRPVGKREFGETCQSPLKSKGYDFTNPGDFEWKEFPSVELVDGDPKVDG